MKKFDICDLPCLQEVGVYAIHNKKTDKYYIGSATNIYYRCLSHMRSLQKLEGINEKMKRDIQSAEDLHKFEWIIIETFKNGEITNIQLRTKEWEYIKKYKAIENGYNKNVPVTGNIPRDAAVSAHDYMTDNDKNSLIFYVPKHIKQKCKSRAKELGKTLNAYFLDLAEQDMRYCK